MGWVIRTPSRCHPFRTPVDLVCNDYTDEPKTFPTYEAAKRYAHLSHLRGVTIKDDRRL